MITKVLDNRGRHGIFYEAFIQDNFFYFDVDNGKYDIGVIPLELLKRKIEEHEGRLTPVENLRKSYFAYRDKLHDEGNTGYSKVELHELSKKYVFPKLVENPDNFINGGKDQHSYSVTWLSEQGWKSYIEEFKLFAAENFNFYL